jgi:endonuclease I
MKLHKILIVTLLLTIGLFLSGCKGDVEYEITLSSNVEGATLEVTKGKMIMEEQAYIISTTEIEGYTFEYWHILGEDQIVSYGMSFTYIPSSDVSLEAVYEEIEIDIIVNASANFEGLTLGNTSFLTNSGEIQYELTAPYYEGYVFQEWINADTDEVLSFDLVYTFVPTQSINITAVYEEYIVVEPTLYYETEFEDASKDAYALGTVTLSDQEWELNDALIGSLATDLKVDGKSVRIRNGYMESQFSVSDIAQVIFYAGTYGSDSAATVLFQLSTDGTTWITIDSFTTTNEMIEHSYVFDEDLVNQYSLDMDLAYYFKIVSETESRTNIDNFSVYTGDGVVQNNESLYTITFTEEMQYQYLVNDIVDLDQCVATHETLGATTCDIIGSVDASTPGNYDITYYKTDEYNNTAIVVVTITIIATSNDYLSMDLMAYYDDAEGLYGDALESMLHTIINTGFSGVTYGDARYILDETDQDPNNANNLILVYLGTSVSGVWDDGVTWNREHLWPQSLLGESADNGTVNMASDLYNLMPSNPAENSFRGNNPYSAMGLGYEPRDEVKGDIARALFYMMIMYDELELVNTAPGLHEMGYLDELIAWHYADPVDDFELARMEIIYGEQYNRNPFVDYPHFVDLIWSYDPTA